MSLNHGTVWWTELRTRNLQAALEYYGAVCGWTFEEMPQADGAYVVATAHGRPVAGIMDSTDTGQPAGVPDRWVTYLAVDDVEAAVEQTRDAGGTVIRAPFDVPEVGRIGMVKDPTGAVVGLIHPVFPGDALVEAEREVEAAETALDDDNFPV